MPKITAYELATELTEDTVLMGVQSGENKRIPASLVGGGGGGGGGEVWEDITDEFSITETSNEIVALSIEKSPFNSAFPYDGDTVRFTISGASRDIICPAIVLSGYPVQHDIIDEGTVASSFQVYSLMSFKTAPIIPSHDYDEDTYETWLYFYIPLSGLEFPPNFITIKKIERLIKND